LLLCLVGSLHPRFYSIFIPALFVNVLKPGTPASDAESGDLKKLQIEVLQPDAAAHAVYGCELHRQEQLYAAVYGTRSM
jgi:hypothetical protein